MSRFDVSERRSQRGLTWALSVAVGLAAIGPTPVHAQPSIPPEAERHYVRGASEQEAGRHASAAQEFAAAYAIIPPTLKELRATVLFDLVQAQRNAFAAANPAARRRGREHPAAHLCAAETALTDFIQAMDKTRKGKTSDDAVKAVELRGEVRQDIQTAQRDAPDLDCSTVEYPSDEVLEAPTSDETSPVGAPPPAKRPRPPIHKPFVIAGSVTTAFGLIMLGVMTSGLIRGQRADADGNALVTTSPTLPEDDPQLQQIDQRGRVGNRMAIAGGVLGGIGLATGVALLVIGLRGGPPAKRARVAVTPVIAPEHLGVGVHWRF